MKLVIRPPIGECGLKNKNWAGGIGAHNLITRQLRWSLGAFVDELDDAFAHVEALDQYDDGVAIVRMSLGR